MQQGPIEEGAKVAGGFIDALRGQPATLALIVSNMALLIFIFYIGHEVATGRQKMLEQEYEYQKHVTELLSKCIVPGRQGALEEEPRKYILLPSVGEPEKRVLDASEPERKMLEGK